MKKRWVLIMVTLLWGLVACSNEAGVNSKETEAANQVVMDYIIASVEGNHGLYNQILIKEEKDKLKESNVLKEDHHAHPGLAKEMGDRYLIRRWDHRLQDGELYYAVKYYHPKNNKWYGENLKLIQVNSEWKVTDISGIDEEDMRKAVEGVEYVTVHESREGEK